MNEQNIEDIISALYDMVQDARALPLGADKCIVERDKILDMLRPSYVRGLTLLGGEPFEPQNQASVVELLRQIKKELPEKSIWAFSGYLFDKDILSGRLGDCSEYLSYLDVLVDGPFVQAKKNLSLRFRGSENQRIIDVPASLSSGEIVLWEDWQGEKKGLK